MTIKEFEIISKALRDYEKAEFEALQDLHDVINKIFIPEDDVVEKTVEAYNAINKHD